MAKTRKFNLLEVEMLASKGLRQIDIAKRLGVAQSVITNRRVDDSDFNEAINRGWEQYEAKTGRDLKPHRAFGIKYNFTKRKTSSNGNGSGEMTLDNTPAPSALYQVAQETPKMVRYRCASDYIRVIVLLKNQKNFTWKEIEQWFVAQKLPFTMTALQSAYQKDGKI